MNVRPFLGIALGALLLGVLGWWVFFGGFGGQATPGIAAQIQSHIASLQDIHTLQNSYTIEIMGAGLGLFAGLSIGSLGSYSFFRRRL